MNRDASLKRMLEALKYNDIGKITQLLEADSTLASLTHVEIREFFESQGDRPAYWPPMLAISSPRGDINIARLLIAHGANVNAGSGFPLIAVATASRLDVMELLLDAGAAVDAQGPSGITAIMAAAEVEFTEGIKMLLDYGASRELNSDNKGSAATRQLVRTYKPASRLPKRVPPEIASPKRLRKLILAITARDTRQVQAMLENHEVTLNPTVAEQRLVQTDEDDGSALPLVVAVDTNNVVMVSILINAGADVNLNDKYNFSPLFVSFARQITITGILLSNGADPNGLNNAGDTPLIAAAVTGNEDAVRLLLDFGAARGLTSTRGTTAADEVRNSPILSAAQKTSMRKLLQTYQPTPKTPKNEVPVSELLLRTRAAAPPGSQAGAPPRNATPAATAAATPAAAAAAAEPTTEAIRTKGNEAFKRGDFARAIELYTKAGDAKSLANRMHCYNKQSQYDLAVGDGATILQGPMRDELPKDVLDKVYNRVGVALYELAENLYAEDAPEGHGHRMEPLDVTERERARQMDLYRTAAYYFGLSNAGPDAAVLQARVYCYRRLLEFDAWETGDVPEPCHGLVLCASLSVCMLCWQANDNTRLVRSNLVPNSVLNLFHPHPEEGACVLYPTLDVEGVSAAVPSVRLRAPHYRRRMYCTTCDNHFENTELTGVWLRDFLESAHDPSYEGDFELPYVSLIMILLSGCLVETRVDPIYYLATPVRDFITSHVVRLRAALLTAKDAPPGTDIQAPIWRMYIDEDTPNDWPLRRHWFGSRLLTVSGDADGRMNRAIWIQLGLCHIVASCELHVADCDPYPPGAEGCAYLGTRAELSARNARPDSFLNLMHSRMLRTAWCRERFGAAHLVTVFQKILHQSAVRPVPYSVAVIESPQTFCVATCTEYNPDVFTRITVEDYLGLLESPRVITLVLLPLGDSGNFPPTGMRAVVNLVDSIKGCRTPGPQRALPNKVNVSFVAGFSSHGKFKGIVDGDGGAIDAWITMLWLTSGNFIRALETAWRDATHKKPTG